jgi:hypothetical protein
MNDLGSGQDKMSSGAGDQMMGHKLCMAQCSYICMAGEGRIESCANLFDFANLKSLPEMNSCPTSTTTINDCFQRCGCQCTRCGVCMMKNMNPVAAKVICWANPNPMKCFLEKKNEALLNCN